MGFDIKTIGYKEITSILLEDISEEKMFAHYAVGINHLHVVRVSS